MFIKQLTVGQMGVCCYIIGCESTKKCAVVDPGGDVDKILSFVNKGGLDVIYILATHGHPDHVCGNGELKDATGAPIVMHQDDIEFFAKPEIENYFSAFGMGSSPPADKSLVDGDEIIIGDEKITVIHTPGHTPGSICLYNGTDLITGDTVFVEGIGRTDFPGGSHQQLMSSINEKLLILPDETIVWPGHGYGGSRSTIGNEKRQNPYF